jgi:hypothetical protein
VISIGRPTATPPPSQQRLGVAKRAVPTAQQTHLRTPCFFRLCRRSRLSTILSCAPLPDVPPVASSVFVVFFGLLLPACDAMIAADQRHPPKCPKRAAASAPSGWLAGWLVAPLAGCWLAGLAVRWLACWQAGPASAYPRTMKKFHKKGKTGARGAGPKAQIRFGAVGSGWEGLHAGANQRRLAGCVRRRRPAGLSVGKAERERERERERKSESASGLLSPERY